MFLCASADATRTGCSLLLLDLLLGEVLLLVRGIDSIGTLFPAGRADLSVLVGELEGLDHSDGLFDGSTDGEIVNVGSSESTLGVDEEGSSESDTLLLDEDTVGLGHDVVSVRELKGETMNEVRKRG